MALMVSLLGAGGTWLPTSPYDSEPRDLLDRRDLLFAPLLVEQARGDGGIGPLVLPVLDALWNAFGHARCEAVRNASGEWQGLPRHWR